MAERLSDEQRHVSLYAYGVGRGVDRAELLHVLGAPHPGQQQHQGQQQQTQVRTWSHGHMCTYGRHSASFRNG